MVSTYAIGSFEPLSSSSRGRRFSFNPVSASQDGENRSRIRRRHRRGQQQRRRKRYGQPDPWGNERDETRYDHRRHDDSGGRQYDTRSDHRSYFRKLGIHTAREKDDTKSDHTYELGRFDGMERNEIDAEQHTDPRKRARPGRRNDRPPCRPLQRRKEARLDQQNVFGRNDIMHRKSLYKFTKNACRVQSLTGTAPIEE